MRLEGRSALVTGASSGIGAAIVEALAREGASVTINYFRNETGARELVGRLEATWGSARGCQFAQCVFHHGQVRFDVSVSGLDTLMTEPEGDHRRVHSTLKQMHRRGVTNQVRRDALALETRTGRSRMAGGPAQQIGNTVTGKPMGTRAGEHEVAKLVAEFAQPASQDLGCVGPQGDGAFLAPFAVQF